ncbi:unnamed protein product [Ixodes persulcatus]
MHDEARWKEERIPRMTSTKTYKLLSYCPNLEERARVLIWEPDFTSRAVRYGLRMEPKARLAFKNEYSTAISLFDIVVLPTEPWLACSSHGLFWIDQNYTTLLEIKCPYSKRSWKLTTPPLLRYLKEKNGIALKKKTHLLYTN